MHVIVVYWSSPCGPVALTSAVEVSVKITSPLDLISPYQYQSSLYSLTFPAWVTLKEAKAPAGIVYLWVTEIHKPPIPYIKEWTMIIKELYMTILV